MRYAVVLFHLVGVLFAADMPYFTDPVSATYFAGVTTRSKATFVPGTLDGCTSKAGNTVTSWACKLKGASLTVSINGADVTFPLDSVHASEFDFDPKGPHSFSYYFSGAFKDKLADGTELDNTTTFFFDRYMGRPTFGRGKFDVGGFGVGGQLFLKFK